MLAGGKFGRFPLALRGLVSGRPCPKQGERRRQWPRDTGNKPSLRGSEGAGGWERAASEGRGSEGSAGEEARREAEKQLVRQAGAGDEVDTTAKMLLD